MRCIRAIERVSESRTRKVAVQDTSTANLELRTQLKGITSLDLFHSLHNTKRKVLVPSITCEALAARPERLHGRSADIFAIAVRAVPT
jgi:hypothetical protein